jgi:hypothetical protein
MRNDPTKDCPHPDTNRPLPPPQPNSGPTINISHQVVYPSSQFSEQDLLPVFPINFYDPNMSLSISQHPHAVHMQPSYPESVPQSYYHHGGFDMFAPDYTYWKPQESVPHSWRPMGPMSQMTPMYPPKIYRPEDSKGVEVGNRPKFSRAEFMKQPPSIIPNYGGVQNTSFFEECFSPKRARRLSIDSDHSNEAHPKNKLITDEEDSTMEILKVNFLNPVRQKKTQDQAKPDYIFNSERILIRQETEPKDRVLAPDRSHEGNALHASYHDMKNLNPAQPHASFWMQPGLQLPRSGSPEIDYRSPPHHRLQHFSAFGPKPEMTFGHLPNRMGQLPSFGATQLHRQPIGPTSHNRGLMTHSNLKTQIQKPEAAIQNLSEKKVIDRLNPLDFLNHKEEPKSHCTCKKSKCLKLYCECFASQRVCGESCNCVECFNKEEYKDLRSYFFQDTLEKNPNAFKSKFKQVEGESLTLHTRGCNCKKTGCSKRYCECYSNKTKCTPLCKCTECLNFCETIDEAEAEKYHERVLRKRKRKSRTFVQSLLERLNDTRAGESRVEKPEGKPAAK